MRSVLLILLCLTLSTGWAKEKKNKRIQYYTTLEEAMQQASRVHKPIFFNCYAGWAGPSILMDSVVLADPGLVAFIGRHFVALRVDMSQSDEGQRLARRYKVESFAHFLILDERGEIVHRIAGGAKAPEFIGKLKKGLDPKTSLAGLTRRYEEGERSVGFLAAYADALNTANEERRFDEVADYYLGHVDSAGMYLPCTWEILQKKGRRYSSEWFRFIYEHRDALTAKNGDKVPEFIVQVAFQQIYPYMVFGKAYDAEFIGEIERKVGSLAFTSASRDQLLGMCTILHLRQQKKYAEMLALWDTLVPALPGEILRSRYDATLGRLQDMGAAEKAQAVAYLDGRMQGMPEGTLLAQYRHTVKELSDYHGIRFETGSLQEALEKAGKTGRAVFVDCYTSWCGPCKMMSSKVFPEKEAGDYFNPRFVSIKIDMESGEGRELARKWKVSAYPTYLILTPAGEVVYTTQGYIPAGELVRRMSEGLEQWSK